MKYAIETRYLTTYGDSEGKWHTHITDWYDSPDIAWDDNDNWLFSLRYLILESSSSIIFRHDE